jgi:myo-inositol-1(or 4)-monophosphatase
MSVLPTVDVATLPQLEPATRGGITVSAELLPEMVAAVQNAGAHLLARFRTDNRPDDLDQIRTAIAANDQAALELLRAPLLRARPGSRWAEDEEGGGLLPDGEWWVTDPVEGNINNIHGMLEWGVTATLVRDNEPVVTAIHVPAGGNTYTAVHGGGAFLDGAPLRVSAKQTLAAALVGTGQAKPGEDADTLRRTGRSVTAMLGMALLTRVSVPSTMQLIQVAAGRMDAFWQYTDIRSGLLAGALLVAEAGGTITDTHGRPWTPTSDDFLGAAPGLHAETVAVLATVA